MMIMMELPMKMMLILLIQIPIQTVMVFLMIRKLVKTVSMMPELTQIL